jgi:hypothetical protein
MKDALLGSNAMTLLVETEAVVARSFLLFSVKELAGIQGILRRPILD